MLEVADIVRAAGPEVCAHVAVLPNQKRALDDILRCRTAQLGGQIYGCLDCGKLHFSYHSCGNRHCPKCHGQRTQKWLQKQKARLPPCPYYLLTFTLPASLRGLAYGHQKILYGLLLNAAAASIQELCADPHWLGAQVFCLAVLHTWTRALLYHPHVHFLVSAGGLSLDGQEWIVAKNPQFLLPVRALSVLFRAKIRDGLQSAGLLEQAPAQVWDQNWVVHAQHAGSGEKVLDYLGRYVFRIAISQSRLEKLENAQVTFRYRDNQSQQIKHVQISATEFVRRLVQHVLPQGFAKVRHYGLASASCGERRKLAFSWLRSHVPGLATLPTAPSSEFELAHCPTCGSDRLIFLGHFRKISPALLATLPHWLAPRQLLPSLRKPP